MQSPDEQRAEVAREAIRQAEIEAVKNGRSWRIVTRVGSVKNDGTDLKDARPGEVFVEGQTIGRRDVVDFIAELMVERDEWRRRAEKHGCDVDRGDPDCG